MKVMDNRLLIGAGFFFCSLGLYWMGLFNLQVDYTTAMIARVVQCFGLAFLFVPLNVMAYRNVPPDKIGYASGLLNLVRNYGGSTGIALMTTLLSRRNQLHHVYLLGNLTPTSIPLRNFISHSKTMMMSHGYSPADALHKANGMVSGIVSHQAAMMSFADVFWLISMLSLLAIPLLLFVQVHKQKKIDASVAVIAD